MRADLGCHQHSSSLTSWHDTSHLAPLTLTALKGELRYRDIELDPSIVFISAAESPQPGERGDQRTWYHGNKNLCEHFHEKRECNVENMSRHVRLCRVLERTNYRGDWEDWYNQALGLIRSSQVGLDIWSYSLIYIAINPRDTQTVGGGPVFTRKYFYVVISSENNVMLPKIQLWCDGDCIM